MADDTTEAANDAAAAARPTVDTAEVPAEDSVLALPSDAAARARNLLRRVPAEITGDCIARQFDTIVLLMRPLS